MSPAQIPIEALKVINLLLLCQTPADLCTFQTTSQIGSHNILCAWQHMSCEWEFNAISDCTTKSSEALHSLICILVNAFSCPTSL